jgi:hypothetical protein
MYLIITREKVVGDIIVEIPEKLIFSHNKSPYRINYTPVEVINNANKE